LGANTLRSPKFATIRSAKNVARIARPPSSGGSSAATSERKNSSDSRKMNGNASSSACARSLLTWVLACAFVSASPPSLTSRWPANRFSIVCASFFSVVSESGLNYAST
jgi:hypothetical protein